MKKLEKIIACAFALGLGAAGCDVGPEAVAPNGDETPEAQLGDVDIANGDEAVEAVEYQAPQRFGIEAWSGVDVNAPRPAAPATVVLTRANREARPVPASHFDAEKLIEKERPALDLSDRPR